MSQLKPILNVNSNFERGNIDGFTETVVGTPDLSFLDRRDDMSDPKRKIFPQLLKSASDYIYNGRFARRYFTDIGEAFTTQIDPVAVDPGMKISVNIVYRKEKGTGLNLGMLLEGLLSGGSSTFAVRGDVNDTFRVAPGNPFNYIWQTVSESNPLPNGGGEFLTLWFRVGFTIDIPQDCVQLTPSFVVETTAPPTQQSMDLGEFSIQALDSRIHAGG